MTDHNTITARAATNPRPARLIRHARPGNVLDCSKAFVDFCGIDQSTPFGSTWAPSL
ncbi:hypothetical protein [Burkholderia ambifaria]|uniref:Uncharacterized protein n=1 Tax=Burkholderia ambifaria MEX-5 TaxID=396597 RepID=B1T8E3_9BURK|nr:hypothetical protein [Burkholderia ambifaria]EDT40146.1 hypothetical protein BamMEX5DRAFT_4059 [Burkholderia ambifaria MEX-5]